METVKCSQNCFVGFGNFGATVEGLPKISMWWQACIDLFLLLLILRFVFIKKTDFQNRVVVDIIILTSP